ncbi:MAG: helix-turn-helix domain-containing protein [Thiobacillus sp.]|nr:helix-turn-helix domain-containing protein [Thiobacillus sp.]
MNIDAVPLIRASQVRPFLAAMDCIGAPRERLLRQSKLPLLAYDDAEAVLPELFLWELADKVARNQGIEDFGLLAATHMPVWESEPELIGLLRSLPTLWIALSRFCRLSRQYSNTVRFEITRKGNQALLECDQIPSAPGEDQSELYDLKLMIQIVQLAAGREWAPPEVFVSPVNVLRLTRSKEFERVRIRRSDTFTCVAFPADMLAWPMQGLAHPCGLQLPNPLADTFLDSLGAIIGTYLQYRTMNIQLAAEMAGLSTRTFQRRLADLQLDYSTLIDQIRLKQALSFLSNPDVPLTEIAYDLGYSDAAHFTRAFHRWTALSPHEYRRQHQVV